MNFATVTSLLSRLRQSEVTYFPVRHHSPACARHVERWIEQHRPAAVLIEGPQSFTQFVDALVHPECHMPVALYTNFVDLQGRLLGPEAAEAIPVDLRKRMAARFAAYYPLCDYSPELVALRKGRETGARLKFIDLEFAEKVLSSHSAPSVDDDTPAAVEVESLMTDPHLVYSEYTRALCHKLGCRDFNELWDHLFESHGDSLSTEEFMDRVATFCCMTREAIDPRQLQHDGTHAREACMAAAVCEELEHQRAAGGQRPVLVVTGGFHTVALPELVAQMPKRPKSPKLTSDEAGTWLIRYSFDRLDALSGYASGMPSPGFYDRLWQTLKTSAPSQGSSPSLTERVAELILEVAHISRERQLPTAISTPDAMSAVHMAEQLARLRGHDWPQREDVLDGMRSCLVKGEMQAEGQLLMSLVRRLLAGDRVGRVPPGTGSPPIVDDFHRVCRRLKLPGDSIEPRQLTLDLYRQPRQREISRVLHRLSLLGVSYGSYLAGPDFVHGHDLDRMTEEWRVQWSSATESSLIEVAVYGSSLEEAAIHKLLESIGQLEQEGSGRSTALTANLLIKACQMGLHQHAGRLLHLIERFVADDPDLSSVTSGMSQLSLLQDSREPLEAMQLTEVPHLIQLCFQRSCELVRETYHCPKDAVDTMIRSFGVIREIVARQRLIQSLN